MSYSPHESRSVSTGNASDADLFSRCTLVDGYRSIVVDGAERIRPTRNRMKLGPKLFWTAKHDLIIGVIKMLEPFAVFASIVGQDRVKTAF